MSVVAASASVAETKTDGSIAEKMCNEADNFLSTIPSDQADIWVEAINLAIDGDNSSKCAMAATSSHRYRPMSRLIHYPQG